MHICFMVVVGSVFVSFLICRCCILDCHCVFNMTTWSSIVGVTRRRTRQAKGNCCFALLTPCIVAPLPSVVLLLTCCTSTRFLLATLSLSTESQPPPVWGVCLRAAHWLASMTFLLGFSLILCSKNLLPFPPPLSLSRSLCLCVCIRVSS